ncbi:MAG TPA: alanine--tRNA ligase [Actinomycetota bacterium]|nr:alanine--tRNA ligase [Actinomycetota bacterium]
MDSNTIRQKFVAFFEERGHARVPSSSLVPNDPSLLLTNAGMNQFKPYFLGEQQAPWPRALSIQKCFRTTDIDEVGKTARHLTFFEMLGNFSFGDYYKQNACPWAWELVTESFGIDPELLWVTIYETDDEAQGVWADEVGVRPERILRWDKENNFWSMGVAGPCGPCSEIYVDLGERFGDASDQGPIGNGDRYLEIWNLVFMQNDCNAAIEPVSELPRKNIDTGAGVERLAQFLQGAGSIYETDTIGTLVQTASSLTGKTYGSDARTDRGLRILADHGRSLTFLIGDGVMPSNTERGYVLRRVMRRAIREARLLGRNEPVLPALITTTIELMGAAYPELVERRDFILEVAEREEQRFDETLRQGLGVLESEMGKARDLGAGVPGDAAFRLHDSFGFPIDLTVEIAGESGLDVDIEAFEVLMAEQRNRARAARKTGEEAASVDAAVALLEEHGATEFVGNEHLQGDARVIGILEGPENIAVASEGDVVDLVLDRTTFYAEGGGQVGDQGTIRAASGVADVLDTRRVVPGLTGHRVKVRAGEIRTGDQVELGVDATYRRGCERAHTATHILHWVLRDRLGEHATQAGSLVEPGRLRFDFNHFDALAGDQLTDVAGELQTRVGADDGVRAYETSFDYARSIGAMAIFGEKYGDFVRVVEVGEYSKELCGGTHVAHTSQIGVVVVTGESSVGANLRRVEALVGREGLSFLESKLAVLARTATLLKTNPDEVAERVERLVSSHKELERKLAETEQRSIEADAAALADAAQDVDGTRLVVARRDLGVDNLRKLAQLLKGRLGSAVVVLGAAADGRANLVAALTKDLVSRGLSARDLLAPGAQLLGGGAGGKPELSISGGPAAGKVDEALEVVAEQARQALRP